MLGINMDEIDRRIRENTEQTMRPFLDQLMTTNEYLAAIYELLEKLVGAENSGS